MKYLVSASIVLVLLTRPWGSPAFAEMPAGEQASVQPASAGTILQEADRLEQQGQYEAAAAQYAAIPTTSPDWQRAAVMAGACLEKAGKLTEAVATYDAAIAKTPSAYQAELATFQKARACKAMGNTAEARRCVDRIKTRFPDSSSFADALLLQAQMDGGNVTAAEALVAKEQQATSLYKQAMLADRSKDEAAALQMLDTAILQYPGTPAALRCRDARAHILTRHKEPEAKAQAGAEFAHILTLVTDSAPNSRVAETARLRLAALHHSFRNRQDAIAAYEELTKSEDKAVASRAALQLAGLQFELLQREHKLVAPVSDARWDEFRALCALVAGSKDAKPIEKARAEVMGVESYTWQGRLPDTLAAADAFLTKYRGGEFKQDIATVRFFAGQAARKTREYDRALAHFRWIADAYQGQGEVWPGLDHMPRTYFAIWDILRRTKAPSEDLARAADTLLTAFPESPYAEHVRIQTAQDTQTAEAVARFEARLKQLTGKGE